MTWLSAHFEVTLIAATLALLALGWIARRVPALGVATGVILVAAAAALVLMFDRRWFQSEGSAAGLFVFAIYAAGVAVLAILGLWFLGSSLSRIARGADGKRNYAKAAMFAIGVPVAMAVTVHLSAIAYILWLPNLDKTPPSGPTLVSRTTVVKDQEYLVSWKSRTGAVPLALLVQPADFLLAANEVEARVGETADGPVSVDLAIPSAEATLVSLRLHRHDNIVDEGTLDALRSSKAPSAFWVERNDGRWKFLGFACTERTATRCFKPDAPLARWVPPLFGLQRVTLHVARDRSNARCDMSFRYEGRVATVSTREACNGAAATTALESAVGTLARIAADAQHRPDERERRKREQDRVERCEAAARSVPAGNVAPESWRAAQERAESVCDHAQRLAAVRLRSNAADAAPAVLRAMQAKTTFNSSTRFESAQEVAEALATAGPRDPDGIRAHALRAAWLRERGQPAAAQQARDVVVPLAGEVLPPDDATFDTLDRVGDELDEPARRRHLQMLALRHERALAGGANSPLETRTRYDLCSRRVGWNLERETLKDCGDKLLAAWTANPAAPPFDRAPNAVMRIGSMYASYGWAANEFGASAADVRALRETAATRLPPSPEREGALGRLDAIGAELAAKIAPPAARASR